MAHAIEKENAKQVHLKIDEPLKFFNILSAEIQKLKNEEYDIVLFFGGPEKFPSNTYKNEAFIKDKIQAIIYLSVYWTRMEIEITGKSKEENLTKINDILLKLKDQIEEI